MAGTLPIPSIGSASSVADPKIKESLETLNGKLNAENKLLGTNIAAAAEITNAMLSAEAKPFDWYTPKVIATEETRENTAFATLTTADEIKEVVLPTNGLIQIGYVAKWKSSVGSAGRAAIFLGATQLKGVGTAEVLETATIASVFGVLVSSPGESLIANNGETAFATTGVLLGRGGTTGGGIATVFAAAGTYNISIQYRATSGNVVAKERKLWVGVQGV